MSPRTERRLLDPAADYEQLREFEWRIPADFNMGIACSDTTVGTALVTETVWVSRSNQRSFICGPGRGQRAPRQRTNQVRHRGGRPGCCRGPPGLGNRIRPRWNLESRGGFDAVGIGVWTGCPPISLGGFGDPPCHREPRKRTERCARPTLESASSRLEPNSTRSSTSSR